MLEFQTYITVFGSDCIWLETCRTYTPDFYSVQYCQCSKLDCSEKLECDSGDNVEIEEEEELKQDQDYLDEFKIPSSHKPSFLALDTSSANANNWFNTAFGLCLEPAERLRCQSVLMQKIFASIATLGLVGT